MNDSVELEVVHHSYEEPYKKSAVIIIGIFDDVSADELVFLTAACGKPISSAIIKNKDLKKLGGKNVFKKYNYLNSQNQNNEEFFDEDSSAFGIIVYMKIKNHVSIH